MSFLFTLVVNTTTTTMLKSGAPTVASLTLSPHKLWTLEAGRFDLVGQTEGIARRDVELGTKCTREIMGAEGL